MHFLLLADVRSLALPGSYHEKVTHLGRSLIGFTRLKQLDLSRNALRSLEVHHTWALCTCHSKGSSLEVHHTWALCTCHSEGTYLCPANTCTFIALSLQGLDQLKMLETLNMYPVQLHINGVTCTTDYI